MTSDTYRYPPDAPFAPASASPVQLFRCPRCNGNRPMSGRRLRRYMGLRTWLCAQCVKPREDVKAAA